MICDIVKSGHKNYIFDLYGTLMDISTNERKATLWEQLSAFYNVYGCGWTGKTLSENFWRMDREERDNVRKELGVDFPEIRLEKVFARLFRECPSRHRCTGDVIRRDLQDLVRSETVYAVANAFRVLSRSRMGLYPYTEELLKDLKKEGKGVYLLSNAQRIFTWPEIEQTGLVPYFDAVYISSDHYMMKPQPEYMKLLITKEGLDPKECLMIGNEMKSDILVAARTGVESVYLNTSHYSRTKLKRLEDGLFAQYDLDDALRPRIEDVITG